MGQRSRALSTSKVQPARETLVMRWKSRVSPTLIVFLGVLYFLEALLGGRRGPSTRAPRAFGYFQPEATLSFVLLSPYVDCTGAATSQFHAQPTPYTRSRAKRDRRRTTAR